MNELRFTLLSDGSSDRTLLPPISWLLYEKLLHVPVQLEWAGLGRIPRLSKGLARRIEAAIDYYPCDVLLVHRDAEGETRKKRVDEIETAISELSVETPHVCVVTVRMQEAWMLIDEQAIRAAAGNPNGAVALSLPKLKKLEDLPDPKQLLHELLRTASELTGRRLKKFSASANAHRVAELTENWQLLRNLPAFAEFKTELELVLQGLVS